MLLIDWLNDNTGFVQATLALALVLVTVIYAFFTGWLTLETRRMRRDDDRPDLFIEIPQLKTVTWKEPPGGQSPATIDPLDMTTWPDPYTAYPETVVCRIANGGRGTAKEVAVTAAHHSMSYRTEYKDFLIPRDEWHVGIAAFPMFHAGRVQDKNLLAGLR